MVAGGSVLELDSRPTQGAYYPVQYRKSSGGLVVRGTFLVARGEWQRTGCPIAASLDALLVTELVLVNLVYMGIQIAAGTW